jgi:hypothetical protein
MSSTCAALTLLKRGPPRAREAPAGISTDLIVYVVVWVDHEGAASVAQVGRPVQNKFASSGRSSVDPAANPGGSVVTLSDTGRVAGHEQPEVGTRYRHIQRATCKYACQAQIAVMRPQGKHGAVVSRHLIFRYVRGLTVQDTGWSGVGESPF